MIRVIEYDVKHSDGRGTILDTYEQTYVEAVCDEDKPYTYAEALAICKEETGKVFEGVMAEEWTFGELRSDYKSSPYYRALDQGSDEVFDSAEPYDFAKNEDGTVAFKFLNEDIWDKYITAKVLDEEKKYRDRISKGLELFGRYFENLWD